MATSIWYPGGHAVATRSIAIARHADGRVGGSIGLQPGDRQSPTYTPRISEAYMPDYRYTLERDRERDDAHQGRLVWVMLNPSTADATTDDNTIRRVKSYSWREGADRLTVVNLFAARATRPIDLIAAFDPVGPDNTVVVERELKGADGVIFAWGSWPYTRGKSIAHRAVDAFAIAKDLGLKPGCLGITRNGGPLHPLYKSVDLPIIDYEEAIRATS